MHLSKIKGIDYYILSDSDTEIKIENIEILKSVDGFKCKDCYLDKGKICNYDNFSKVHTPFKIYKKVNKSLFTCSILFVNGVEELPDNMSKILSYVADERNELYSEMGNKVIENIASRIFYSKLMSSKIPPTKPSEP